MLTTLLSHSGGLAFSQSNACIRHCSCYRCSRPGYCLTLHSRREDRLALGVILNLLLGCLVERGTVTLVLLRNPLLEGAIKLRLL
jgi:hypothetical protein